MVNKKYENIDFSILSGKKLKYKEQNDLYNDKSIELWKEEMKFAGASIAGGFLISGIANLFGFDIDDEITATIIGANLLKKEIDKYQLEYGGSVKSSKIKNKRTVEEALKDMNIKLEDDDIESEEMIIEMEK